MKMMKTMKIKIYLFKEKRVRQQGEERLKEESNGSKHRMLMYKMKDNFLKII